MQLFLHTDRQALVKHLQWRVTNMLQVEIQTLMLSLRIHLAQLKVQD